MSGFSQNTLSKIQIKTDIRPGWPLILDSNSMAFRIGIKNRTLWNNIRLINQSNSGYKNKDGMIYKAYNCFAIKDFYPDGKLKKRRYIQEPNERLKYIHKSLNGLFSSMSLPKPITAYVKGLSYVEGARQHVRQSYWIPKKIKETDTDILSLKATLDLDKRYEKVKRHKDEHDNKSPEGDFYWMPTVNIHLDIKNFFNSIPASWIRHFFFHSIGYNHTVSGLFATLSTVNTGKKRFLPQGSPLSGSLANLVAYHRFGQKIDDLLKSHSPDWVWTIYSDDINLSHPDSTITKEEVDKITLAVKTLVEDAGFLINQEKTRVLYTRYDRVVILGCVVNEKLNLPKEVLDNYEFYIRMAKKYGWDSLLEKLESPSGDHVYQKINGMLQHIRAVRPDKYADLEVEFQEALQAHPVGGNKPVVLVDEREEVTEVVANG